MATIPTVTEDTIRAWVGDANYKKGMPYASRDVADPRRQGSTLKAYCQGTMPAPYQITIQFGKKEIEGADCSCPVGEGGHCKHVAAVLIVYKDHPDWFIEVEDLDTALNRRSKEDLIVLIKQFIRQQPDLESFITVPVLESGQVKTRGTAYYNRQAKQLIQRNEDAGGSAYGIAQGLEKLLVLAEDFLEQGNHEEAAEVFQGIAGAISDFYNIEADEEGDILIVHQKCAAGLHTCFQAETKDTTLRQALLESLWNLIRWDITLGGIEAVDPDLVEHLIGELTPKEKQKWVNWIQADLADHKNDAYNNQWRKETYGSLILDLIGDSLSDEAYLQTTIEYGLDNDRIGLLLHNKQIEEALKVIEESVKTKPGHFLNYCDLLVVHKFADQAEKLVEKQLAQETGWNRTSLLQWQLNRAVAKKNKTEVAKLRHELFAAAPTMQGYEEIKAMTPKAEWPEVRKRLLQPLLSTSDFLVIEILIKEKDTEALLQRLATKKTLGRSLDIAKAIQDTHPEEAIEVYHKHALECIHSQGRSNYQQACRNFQQILKLLEKNKKDTSKLYQSIEEIVETNKSLRALKEELISAKLYPPPTNTITDIRKRS